MWLMNISQADYGTTDVHKLKFANFISQRLRWARFPAIVTWNMKTINSKFNNQIQIKKI